MGKRKTRKRSKSGRGLFGKPAAAGTSICAWYGTGNNEKAIDKCPADLVALGPDHPLRGKIHPIAYEIKSTWGLPHDVDVKGVDSQTVTQVHNTLTDPKLKVVDDKLTAGYYDVYYILYEEECKYGGERFELMKLTDVAVKRSGKTIIVTSQTPKWKNEMKVIEEKDATGASKLSITWGTKNKSLPTGSLFAIKKSGVVSGRRNTIGGKRRRRSTKKRRRSTKKKRRKKRKRTKKRRRRR